MFLQQTGFILKKNKKNWGLMVSKVILSYNWPIKPKNLGPQLIKSSQSNSNLGCPNLVLRYLITTLLSRKPEL